MDEQYLIAPSLYIELNLVKAGIVKKPEDYKWSSA
jgi:putative transposase